jgi:hypothetical protein
MVLHPWDNKVPWCINTTQLESLYRGMHAACMHTCVPFLLLSVLVTTSPNECFLSGKKENCRQKCSVVRYDNQSWTLRFTFSQRWEDSRASYTLNSIIDNVWFDTVSTESQDELNKLLIKDYFKNKYSSFISRESNSPSLRVRSYQGARTAT